MSAALDAEQAIRDRDLIESAIFAVMAHRQIDEASAAADLCARALDRGCSVAEVATQVVEAAAPRSTG